MVSLDPWLDRSQPSHSVVCAALLTDLDLFALMEDFMPHTEIGVPAKADLPLSAAKAARADNLQDALPGAVHDLGNLIQVAASALNILSRNPQVEGDPSLPPIVASARMSLGRAGTLVEQT